MRSRRRGNSVWSRGPGDGSGPSRRRVLAGGIGAGALLALPDLGSSAGAGVSGRAAERYAFVYGTPEYPLTDIPFQKLLDWAEAGLLKLEPARVFGFADIQQAHRTLDAEAGAGKMVVTL